MAAPTALSPSDTPAPIAPSSKTDAFPLWVRLVIVGLALVYVAVHLVAVFRENINWDEFALLARSVESIQSGRLVGGGRPGLGTLVLIPFVEGCTNSVTAVVNARLFWSLFTFSYLAGIYALVAHIDGRKRWSLAGIVAVALIALVPLFQRWSVQVRTDQPALAFATWGGVALLASRRRPWLAAVAGLLFAIGGLFTQKAAYVVLLTGVLAIGDLWLSSDFSLRREAMRAVAIAVVGALAIVVYRVGVSLFFEAQLPEVGRVYDSMNFYRQLGAMFYKSLPPLVVPHALLLGALIVATAWNLKRLDDGLRHCALALGILALGIVCAIFHASRFAYFWMTIGLFAAVALGIAVIPIGVMVTARSARLLSILVGTLLLVRAVPAGYEITRDTISNQRQTLAFIGDNFPEDATGFHPEKALFCRKAQPLEPTYFTKQIYRSFSGPEGANDQRRFIDDFRARPVSYLVDSFRLGFFPPAIKQFWGDAYVRYANSVFVPGRFLGGGAGMQVPFEVLVQGDYTLYLPPGHPPASISIGEKSIGSGESIRLDAGRYVVELREPVEMALLTLRLNEPPNPTSIAPFYDPVTVAELDGGRRWSWVPGF